MKLQRGALLLFILSYLIRLWGITLPPLEGHHWRQITVAMVAKNISSLSDLFFPALDVFYLTMSNPSGITPMEFPLLNGIMAFLTQMTSPAWLHFWGRITPLVVSLLGLISFFRYTRNVVFKNAQNPTNLAYYATMALNVSLWWSFSRKMMPDTMTVSFMLMALDYGHQYFDTANPRKLVLYTFTVLLAGLTKIPTLYLGVLFILPFLKLPKKIQLSFFVASVIGLLPVFWWYFIWCPELIQRFDNRMFFVGKGLLEGWHELRFEWPQVAEHFTKMAMGYLGFALALIGLFRKTFRQYYGPQFFLGCVGFFLIILKSGHNSSHHNYYIIPFLPLMSILVAAGLNGIDEKYGKNLATFFLLAFIVSSLIKQQHDLRIPKKERYRLAQSKMFQQSKLAKRPIKEWIVMNSGPSPLDIYYTHRKGFALDAAQITINHLTQLKKRGAKYLVINHQNAYPLGIEKNLRQFEVLSENGAHFSIWEI